MKDCLGYVEIYTGSIGDTILNGAVRLLVVNPEQRMTKDQDPGTTNPLTESRPLGEERPETDDYKLTEIIRGRMFCLAHGRECYQRTKIIGDAEWVCPDERHRKPVRSS